MESEITVTLTRPSVGMLAWVWGAASVDEVADAEAVLEAWGMAIGSLSFSRPYPALDKDCRAVLEVELAESVDDIREGEVERWLWASTRGEMESGYFYRKCGPPSRYFRLRYPIDSEDVARWGDQPAAPPEPEPAAPAGPHVPFALGQARTHLSLERQDAYQRRLRGWLASEGLTPPPEVGVPGEDELARMCAFYGCSCELCQRLRDEAQAARFEDRAFGQLVAETPSWLCQLDKETRDGRYSNTHYWHGRLLHGEH